MTDASGKDKAPTSISLVTENYFQEGFAKFLDKKLHDVIVHHTPTKKDYKCHRIILANKSEFFDMLFSVHMKEARKEYVYLTFNDPLNVIPAILEYFYSGNLVIKPDQVIAARIAADQLMCKDLSNVLFKYLDNYISAKNAFKLMDHAIKHIDDEVLEKTCGFIAENIVALEEEFVKRANGMSSNILFGIIGHEKMSSSSLNDESKRSKIVSEVVKDYIKHHKIEEKKEDFAMAVNALVNSSTLSAKDAAYFLVECEKRELDEEASFCATVVASNFNEVDTSFLFKIKPSSFISLLECDDLFVKEEDQVYKYAMNYIEKNKDKLTEELEKKIVSAIRLTFLSVDLLKKLRKDTGNKFIKTKQIVEALMVRILRKEGIEQNDLPRHLRPRIVTAFSYTSDFDKNGILYWIGTKYGEEQYKNPFERKLIGITHNAKLEAGKTKDIVSHTPVSCNMSSQAMSEIVITFNGLTILPQKYSIRHTSARASECLRNWKIQGRKDSTSTKWVDLIEHKNDNSINGKSSTATFSIPKISEYFKSIKLLQTGNNSANNTYLSVAGMEFYGLVRKDGSTKNVIPKKS